MKLPNQIDGIPFPIFASQLAKKTEYALIFFIFSFEPVTIFENDSVNDFANWIDNDEFKHGLKFEFIRGSVYIVDAASPLQDGLSSFMCHSALLALHKYFVYEDEKLLVEEDVFFLYGSAALKKDGSFLIPDNSLKIGNRVIKTEASSETVRNFYLISSHSKRQRKQSFLRLVYLRHKKVSIKKEPSILACTLNWNTTSRPNVSRK